MSNLQDTSPAIGGFTITPNDSTDLVQITRGILVGTSGDLNVVLSGDDNTTLLKNVAAGVVLPLSAKRVYATSTTATDIVGLY